eukprot:938231-Amphidinium_carterae.1
MEITQHSENKRVGDGDTSDVLWAHGSTVAGGSSTAKGCQLMTRVGEDTPSNSRWSPKTATCTGLRLIQ